MCNDAFSDLLDKTDEFNVTFALYIICANFEQATHARHVSSGSLSLSLGTDNVEKNSITQTK